MSDSIAFMKNYTSLGVGGKAIIRLLDDDEKVEEALSGATRVIGNGTNLLISDKGLEGVTVINRLRTITINGESVYASSGVTLPTLALFCANNGLSGLEWACGIPGTVGGAIKMNASAFGGEIASVIDYADLIIGGKKVRLKANELGFSYRSSALVKDCFIVGASFRLNRENKSSVLAKIKQISERRKSTQPTGKSAGSTYLKGEMSAGWYVEKAGLKGRRVGGAVVSRKHANFIINDRNATASDIYELMQIIESTVYDTFGVRLKREIELIGEF